jgi:hypothetical protein
VIGHQFKRFNRLFRNQPASLVAPDSESLFLAAFIARICARTTGNEGCGGVAKAARTAFILRWTF